MTARYDASALSPKCQSVVDSLRSTQYVLYREKSGNTFLMDLENNSSKEFVRDNIFQALLVRGYILPVGIDGITRAALYRLTSQENHLD